MTPALRGVTSGIYDLAIYDVHIYPAKASRLYASIGGRLLLVEHYVAPSPVHGLGVFSRQFIRSGAAVWVVHPVIDREIPLSECQSLPQPVITLIETHGEYLPERGLFRLAADGARFMNHSDQPNLRDEGDMMFAARDIQPGEELFCDYRITKVMSFDPDHFRDMEAKNQVSR